MSVKNYPEVAVVYTNKSHSAGKVVALVRNLDYLAETMDQFIKNAKSNDFEVEVIESYFEGSMEDSWNPSLKSQKNSDFELEDPFKGAINLLKGFHSSESISDDKYKDTFGFATYLETENYSYAEVAGVVMDENFYDCINFKRYATSIGMVITESMRFNLSALAGHWNVELAVQD